MRGCSPRRGFSRGSRALPAALPRPTSPVPCRWSSRRVCRQPSPEHTRPCGRPILSCGFEAQTKPFQFGIRNVISLGPGGGRHHAAHVLFRNRHYYSSSCLPDCWQTGKDTQLDYQQSALMLEIFLLRFSDLRTLACGCGVVVAQEPSKLLGPVRVWSAAPNS